MEELYPVLLSVKCHLLELSTKCDEWSPKDSNLSESKTAATTYKKKTLKER